MVNQWNFGDVYINVKLKKHPIGSKLGSLELIEFMRDEPRRKKIKKLFKKHIMELCRKKRVSMNKILLASLEIMDSRLPNDLIHVFIKFVYSEHSLKQLDFLLVDIV